MPSAFSTYAKWMQSSLLHYEELAKSLVQHKAEKGRIVEGVVKSALSTILPKRFSIGTGFAITSSEQSSSQLDIIIYDALNNSPIILHSGMGLLPIECIYGIIEVKSALDRNEIDSSTKAIGIVRGFAKEKKYVLYGSHTDENDNTVVGEYELTDPRPLSPRSFILTINSKYTTMNTLQEVLTISTEQNNAHVHGLYVLEKNWLIRQKAFTQPHGFICEENKSLATFCTTILCSIQSVNIGAASITRYL